MFKPTVRLFYSNGKTGDGGCHKSIGDIGGFRPNQHTDRDKAHHHAMHMPILFLQTLLYITPSTQPMNVVALEWKFKGTRTLEPSQEH